MADYKELRRREGEGRNEQESNSKEGEGLASSGLYLDLVEVFVGCDGGNGGTFRRTWDFSVPERPTGVPLNCSSSCPPWPKDVLDSLVFPGGGGRGGSRPSSISHKEDLHLSSWSVDSNAEVIVQLALQ
eukprot:595974-Hanusia_phi.AAC.3